MKRDFEGVIPPLTTPFSEDGQILYDSIEKNLEKYLERPLEGFLVLGSTGESIHLDEPEKLQVLSTVSQVVPPEKILIVGLSSSSLRYAQKFLTSIENFRIDAVLVSVPSYYKALMNVEALVRYYQEVAEASPVPIILYNIPQFSGIELDARLVEMLASHPNITGMKESSGNLIYLQKILSATQKDDFQVMSGSAQTFGPAMLLGIRAAIYAVSCAAPEIVLSVRDAVGNPGLLRERQQILFDFTANILGALGIPGVKYAMDLNGYEGRFCREPLRPLNEAQRSQVESVFDRCLVAI